MGDDRSRRIIRLDYWTDEPGAAITFMDGPDELRLSASDKSFITVHDDHISISAGTPSKINIQGMSDSFVFGGMVQDTPWPLTMIPSTTYSTMPRQIIKPPLLPVMDDIAQVAAAALMMLT